MPFANHDDEICQRIHYLNRSFKSYIAIAERSNREHRTHLLLSLFLPRKYGNRYNFSRRHESRTIISAFLAEPRFAAIPTRRSQIFSPSYVTENSNSSKLHTVVNRVHVNTRQDFALQAAWRPALLVEFKYGADNDYETREGQTRENGHGITRCHTYTRDINMRVRNKATRGRTRGENYIR